MAFIFNGIIRYKISLMALYIYLSLMAFGAKKLDRNFLGKILFK